MRTLAIITGLLAALAVGGFLAFQNYKLYLPGFMAQLRDPVQPNQPITFEAGPAEAAAPPAERPPNIIVILADDLGYNDLTFAGGGVAGGKVPTPHIDSLARDGANAAIAYTANGTCSPSRAAIMTGRYPTRFGFEFTAVPAAFAENLSHSEAPDAPAPIFYADRVKGMPPYPDMGMPTEEITIAEVLQARGYHTVHIGKWHLGEAPAMRPEAQGFDASLGIMAGAGLFLPKDDPNVVNAKLEWDRIDRFLWANLPYAVQYNGGERFEPKGYMTDYFTDAAVQAIEANKHRPFFLYLAHPAPHTPLQATKEDYDALAGIEDHTQRVYGAMIRALDRGVGRVLEALKANGLEENTLVIFASDNGGAWYTGIRDLNRPFRGWKATFFEGGVRTPFFLRWPARIPAGAQIAGPVHHMDIFATAAAAAGAPTPEGRDGRDLIPFATGEAQGAPHDVLFWRSGHYRVVRAGDWKLQVSERPEKTWLFNLAEDPTEKRDLAAAEPAKAAELRALIEAHEKDMPAPLWPALLEGPVRIDPPLNAPWAEDQEYVYWAN